MSVQNSFLLLAILGLLFLLAVLFLLIALFSSKLGQLAFGKFSNNTFQGKEKNLAKYRNILVSFVYVSIGLSLLLAGFFRYAWIFIVISFACIVGALFLQKKL